jgi:hypothetical protein
MKENKWEVKQGVAGGFVGNYPLNWFLIDAGTVFGRVRCDCTLNGKPAKLAGRVIVDIE